jgi:hypothetical protein
MGYISSNANRFYTATESSYGQAASITSANRFPAVRLQAHQSLQMKRRLDKTGTRTFLGASSGSRRQTIFEAQTYLTSWSGSGAPSYGPLFQAAMGGAPNMSAGLVVYSTAGSLQLQTTTPHGLSIGSGVSYGGEIRFVVAVLDNQTFVINAPFKKAPQQGSGLATCVTYSLATALPSVSIYDYWDPITAVSRIIVGGAVDTLTVSINGDYHEFTFAGPAADLLDSCSFSAGSAGLTRYPTEPVLETFDYSLVPGHLGEVWLGGPASQFFTLTDASAQVKNNIEARSQEYGSSYPQAISAGPREVLSKFVLLAQDDAQTVALYAAAKQRISIPAMLQLGQQQGQVMGIFMPKVVPEIPLYEDSEPRLQWEFHNNLAQGVADDEITIAFA